MIYYFYHTIFFFCHHGQDIPFRLKLIETVGGYVEKNYDFNVSVLSEKMVMSITWNDAGPYAVYVKRPGSTDYEMVYSLVNGTNGVSVESFGFLAGTNNILIEIYKFDDEKVVRNIAKFSLVLESEQRQVNYTFKLVGGGYGLGGYGITWDGDNSQFYEKYIKKAGSNNFEYLGAGPSSWIILLDELDL